MLLHALMVVSMLTAQIPGSATETSVQCVPVEQVGETDVRDTQVRAQDGPIADDEYELGPGDALILAIHGEQNITIPLSVGPGGQILLPEGELVDVRGLTLAEAQRVAETILNSYYHDVEILMALTAPRSVVLHVTGAVERPGSYELLATTRISRAIEMAGGPLPRASLRGVELRNAGGRVIHADLALYTNAGDLAGNPLAARGNVLHVPFRVKEFDVAGAVNAPGRIGLIPGDRLSDALRVAGGLRPEADMSSVEVVRFDADDSTLYSSETLDLSSAGWEDGDLNWLIEDGDRIHVHRDDLWHAVYRVEVRGEVERAGHYSIVEGKDRLADVIERAGGFSDWADLSQASVVRWAPNWEDTPVGREVTLLTNGEVGTNSTDASEYLRTATVEPSVRVSVDFERVFVAGDADANVLLRGRDVIDVPRRLDVVRVSGAVESPGYVDYRDGGSPRDYIVAAGGFTKLANRRHLMVVRAETGQRVAATGRTRIRPGDTVFVPHREYTQWFEVLKDVLSIASQAATVYIVIDNLSSK